MTVVDATRVCVAIAIERNQDVDHIHRLTTAVASGDPEAFALLYKDKFKFVLQVVRRTTRFDEQTALDMVQDTMLRVVRHMKPIEDEKTLDNWLARIAKHVALDYLKRDRRRRMRELASMHGRSQVTEKSIEEVSERVAWIRRELSGLDRVSVGIIEMRFYADLTLKVIGERLSLSTSVVHARLRRSIKVLRVRIKEIDDE